VSSLLRNREAFAEVVEANRAVLRSAAASSHDRSEALLALAADDRSVVSVDVDSGHLIEVIGYLPAATRLVICVPQHVPLLLRESQRDIVEALAICRAAARLHATTSSAVGEPVAIVVWFGHSPDDGRSPIVQQANMLVAADRLVAWSRRLGAEELPTTIIALGDASALVDRSLGRGLEPDNVVLLGSRATRWPRTSRLRAGRHLYVACVTRRDRRGWRSAGAVVLATRSRWRRSDPIAQLLQPRSQLIEDLALICGRTAGEPTPVGLRLDGGRRSGAG